MTKSINWIWLFPGTYAVHIAEEYWAGERFFNWLSRVADANMTDETFLLLNGVFFLIMAMATAIAFKRTDHRIVVVLASIVLINTMLHVIGSVLDGSYSPGLVSAIVLWLPLAAFAFHFERRRVSAREMSGAIIVGIVAHAVVSLIALGII